MRGKASRMNSFNLLLGITPACAGKSLLHSPLERQMWDHPRVCGEKLLTLYLSASKLGSPPRVRGKVSKYFYSIRHDGITPACAGKSDDYFGKTLHHHGSPPRVRGKVSVFPASRPALRITPACAGKSILPAIRSNFSRDHPRVCGEKTKKSP